MYGGRVGRIRGRYSGPYVDAMKFCFSEGPAGGKAVTRILSHTPIHTIVTWDPVTHTRSRKTFPAQWGGIVTLLKVPDWYLKQSS